MDVPPLLITGMHRSGTSATARLLQHAGVDVGARLMRPQLDNPLGYYEDLDFGELNEALLAAGVGADPSHRPAWAFPELLAPERLAPLRPRAAALIAAHAAPGRPWGFKDPRTAVLLDFYDELVPEARYVFVYRTPWEVVTSLLRTQRSPLQGRAALAVRAWATYNERLLAFRERHPDRTVLVHVDAVAQRPEAVVRLVQGQAHPRTPGQLDPGAAGGAFVGGLLRRADPSSALAQLLAADHPEALALYARLEAAADIASLAPAPGPHTPEVGIEPLPGQLPMGAVLAGGSADGLEGCSCLARPAPGAAPGAAADAAITQLSDEIVVVVFTGRVRAVALAAAAAALAQDPALGVVLLARGDAPAPPCAHDPLDRADPGAAIVVRRDAWLAARGFAPTHAPAGHDAWAFAVACLGQGQGVARIAGGLRLPSPAGEDAEVRRRVLEGHPALAARRALAAEREAAIATRRAEAAERLAHAARGHAQAADERARQAGADAREAGRRTADAEAERARVAAQLEQLRATRSWRLVTGWWRLRGRLRRAADLG